MKHLLITIQTLVAAMALVCATKDESTSDTQQQRHEQQIRLLSRQITEAELHNKLPELLDHHDDHGISMPEYQVTLTGRDEIQEYYA